MFEKELNKELDELAEDSYLIRPIRDVNRAEYDEGAPELREKIIDESVKGVIPDVSDPEDATGRQTGPRTKSNDPAIGDMLDSGHGYGVTTMPGQALPRPTNCHRCGNALLFQIKPCQGSVLPWLPRKTRMIGVPEFDGTPLEWWDAMRLFCKCKTCKELTAYIQGSNKVGSTRKYCSDTCRKGAHKARTAAEKKPAKAKPARKADEGEDTWTREQILAYLGDDADLVDDDFQHRNLDLIGGYGE